MTDLDPAAFAPPMPLFTPTPRRLQLSRRKGIRLPLNAKSVARPHKWGNPFKVGARTHLWHRATTHPFDFYRDSFMVISADQAVGLFRKLLTEPGEYWQDQPFMADGALGELRGHDLACWCKPGDPCHADVLIELANQGES